MVKTLVIAEFATGIPELDLAREKAHAFARSFLKRARGLIFEVAERAFESLDAPVMRVAPPDTPVPYAPTLEEFFLPNVDKVGQAIRALYDY